MHPSASRLYQKTETFIRLSIEGPDGFRFEDDYHDFEDSTHDDVDDFCVDVCERSAVDMGIPVFDSHHVVDIKIQLVRSTEEHDGEKYYTSEEILRTEEIQKWV